jgi:hypothetical protein
MKPHEWFFELIGLGLLGLVGLTLAGVPIKPSDTALLPELCLFQRFLDLSCPGCGMTRAMLSLSSFNWAGAWQFNPLSYPMAVTSLAYTLKAWLPDHPTVLQPIRRLLTP